MGSPLDLVDGDLLLRRAEQRHLEQAVAGENVPPNRVASYLLKLGRCRFERRQTLDGAYEHEFKIACEVIEDLVRERDELAARVERYRETWQLRGRRLHEARVRLLEFDRVLAERDELRQAARDADARYIALRKRVAA